MKSDILVIGETCTDVFYYGECDRLCPEAPVPVFVPTEIIKTPGMAMNVQKNIQSLYGSCDIHTNTNWKDITKTRFIHLNTNQMFVRVDENDHTVKRCDVSKVDLNKYKIVVISDYCKGFLTESDISYISDNHNCVFLDTKKVLGDWCTGVRFIKINHYEYNKSKDRIPENVKDKLIVTLGPKGCKYKDKVYPVRRVDIRDVSGAGDTFLSGLVAEYLRTSNIESSISYANECATIAVQKKGVTVI